MADSITPVSKSDRDKRAVHLRILETMTRLTVDHGYEHTTIQRLLEDSQVARATFYRHVTNKRDCLLAAQRHSAQLLLQTISDSHEDPWHALVAFAQQNPYPTRLLADVPVLADRSVLDEHHRLRTQLADLIRARGSCPVGLPIGAMAGAVLRVLAWQPIEAPIEHGEQAETVTRWVGSHIPQETALPQLHRLEIPALAIESAPSSSVLERTRAGDRPGSGRMKILQAALNEIDNGNSSFTIGEVAAAAGASRETFYGHFADRAAALDALRQIVFGEVFALCMRAYVSYKQWPLQIWQVSHILTSYLELYPRLGRFLLLSPLRSQPKQREPGSSDCLGAFEIFLEPGAVDVEADAKSLYARLTTAAVFDLLNQSLSEDRRVTALLPQIGFLALAPSISADRAVSLIEQDLSNQDRPA